MLARWPHQFSARDRLVNGSKIVVCAALIFAALVRAAGAQIPGAPLLQNAWATPGIVAAINIGGGSDGTVYAAAASWTPSSGRFEVSGGAGAQSRTGAGSRGVYGVRLAMPLRGSPTASIGFAAFAGVGGGGGRSATNSSVDSTTASSTNIPVGVAIGWRRAIGATHGFSLYASPSYVFESGGSKSGGLVRAAVGVDVGITSAIGITAGAEFGQTRVRALGGPSGTLYGFGVAYALGHR
jgi:hypothetical protein